MFDRTYTPAAAFPLDQTVVYSHTLEGRTGGVGKMCVCQAAELQLMFLLVFCCAHCQHTPESMWSVKTFSPALETLYQQYCTFGASDTKGKLFTDWSFSNKSPLLEFPIDQEERNYIRKVHNVSFSHVMPTPFHSPPVLVALSSRAVQDILDLDPCDTSLSQGFLAMASGGQSPPNTLNLAHRYGGHQFGYWAGQLGDGRAVLLGSYVNHQGGYWEAQLKGSGKTPYSRRGDGRAVVRSSVREFLASEAMHGLGIPTSRAASLVVSSDTAWRDQFYDGHARQEPTAIVLRLAPSWFRIGSLEILYYNQEVELLQQTVDFVIGQYFSDLALLYANPSARYAAFFARVVNQTAHMIAHWQSVGFTHGVCNTDNFSLLSLTIDYGPFGFMDQYNPDFVPNTSDDEGMYRYQYQPSVGYYNLAKLQQAMKPLLQEEREVHRALMLYPAAFNDAFLRLMSEKLGLTGIEDMQAVEILVTDLLQMMEDKGADFTMTFRELSEITMAKLVTDTLPGHYWALPRLLAHGAWRGWLLLYHSLTASLATSKQSVFIASYSEGTRQERMQMQNPRYVLRNWMAEEAIRSVEQYGDFSVIFKLQHVLENPFIATEEGEVSGYAQPPPSWAQKLRVSCSS